MSTTTNRLRLMPFTNHILCLWVSSVVCLVGLNNAFAQDQIGIYWDDQYTTNNASTPSTPGVLTGYLVLHNPTGFGGIQAWEACIEIDGPGTLTSFDFQGQAINAGSEPCFAVGYTTPLPFSAAVLLASFQAIALEQGPIYVSIKPDFNASLPGHMSYISADDPENLIAMTTVTGNEKVASLNEGNVNLTVVQESLNFGSVAIGDSLTQYIRVNNSADTPYVIDHGFDGVCSSFSLPNGDGMITVPPMSFAEIEVLFVPEVSRQVNCKIFLSFINELIPITGNGEEPVTEYNIGGSRSWGDVAVGASVGHQFFFDNNGTSSITTSISIDSPSNDFTITAGGGALLILPGTRANFSVQFAPSSPGFQDATIVFSNPSVTNVTVNGTGTTPVVWRAPTALSFGTSYLNEPAVLTFPITNLATTPLPIFASLNANCSEFLLLEGGDTEIILGLGDTHYVTVQFQAPISDNYICQLDLGVLVPDVTLNASVIAGPSSIAVSAPVLSFPPTAVGTASEMNLYLHNVSGENVSLNLATYGGDPEFSIAIGGGPQTLIPGQDHLVRVRFNPSVVDINSSFVNLGSGFNVVRLLGESVSDNSRCLATPSVVNFGAQVQGANATEIVTISNNTGNPVFIDPTSTSPQFTISGSAVTLQSGQTADISITMNTSVLGPLSGAILLGDSSCAPIPLTGQVVLAPSTFVVSPASVIIPTIAVGSATDREITATNSGTVPIDLDIKFLAPSSGFLIVSGGGIKTLAPEASHVVVIRFLALFPADFNAALSFGPYLPIVPISANAANEVSDCDVSATNVNFGPVSIGDSSAKIVTITNHTANDMPITPNSNAAELTVNPLSLTIPPISSVTLTITYTPTNGGTFNGTISLGNGACLDIDCFGQGIIPEEFDKDVLGVFWDENYLSNNTYNNPTNAVIEGYLVLSEPSQSGGVSAWEAQIKIDATATLLSWQLEGDAINVGEGNEYVVGLGTPLPFTSDALLATFTVLNLDANAETEIHGTPNFVPSVPGQMSWIAADLPSALLPIHTASGTSLLGSITPNQVIDTDWYSVSPGAIDIPAVVVGTIVDNTIVVSNIGPVEILFEVNLQEPVYGFEILAGDGLQLVAPGATLDIELRFLCISPLIYATSISLGTGLPLITVDAIGVAPVLDCDIAELALDFGDVSPGSSRSRFIEITNTADAPMSITPVSSSPFFVVDTAEVILLTGESKSIQVVFQPVAESLYNGFIDLGNALCETVACLGEGIIGENFDADLLGIFFDPEFTQFEAYGGVNEVLTGYLVLTNPGLSGGVLAWECKVELFGNAQILGWNLEGDNINLGTGNEFIVGLASPLPYTDQALLASFLVLNTDPINPTFFYVKPVRIASVPNQMSWVAASSPNDLLPMHTVGNEDLVALISPSSPVAIEAPTPHAQVFGQQINISWPAPVGSFDGSHLYRRLPGELAIRLTDRPLIGSSEITFTDNSMGLPPGAKIYYSYALIKDGVEKARSAEVEITLPVLPAVATRLLPNVPNPFNPMTEIKFELNKTEHMSLKIYDVTGRLVRELANGTLTSGPHSRTWQGRDGSGRQVPSGTYYVRLVTQTKIDNRKIMLLK